mmetsp:Transcript_32192/g.54291  ORF Transcript_32192/g.54291 Transcript_32192/m.54291 type:complete len:308 (+) Transcript_32192:95-1018(+)
MVFNVVVSFLGHKLFSHKFLYEERPAPDVELEQTENSKLIESHPKGSDRAFAPVHRTLSRANSVTSVGSATSGGGGGGIGSSSTTFNYASAEEAAAKLNPLHREDEEEGLQGSALGSGSRPNTNLGSVKEDELEEDGDDDDDDDDEDEDLLGWEWSLFWLGVITVFIAILSDAISASIEEAAEECGISKVFLAAIILPIVGNAAEHAGAVMFAMKGKLDLSLGVAIGSSTQIGLCVLPLLVLIGWMGGYDLTLNFGSYEAASLLLSVVTVTFAIKDGHSNWLLGFSLVMAYVIISAGFWAHNNAELD